MSVLQLPHELVLSSRRVDSWVRINYVQRFRISEILFIRRWTIGIGLPMLDEYHRRTQDRCKGCGKEQIVEGDKYTPEKSAE